MLRLIIALKHCFPLMSEKLNKEMEKLVKERLTILHAD